MYMHRRTVVLAVLHSREYGFESALRLIGLCSKPMVNANAPQTDTGNASASAMFPLSFDRARAHCVCVYCIYTGTWSWTWSCTYEIDKHTGVCTQFNSLAVRARACKQLFIRVCYEYKNGTTTRAHTRTTNSHTHELCHMIDWNVWYTCVRVCILVHTRNYFKHEWLILNQCYYSRSRALIWSAQDEAIYTDAQRTTRRAT